MCRDFLPRLIAGLLAMLAAGAVPASQPALKPAVVTESTPRPASPRPDIVLVTFDTTRRDHVSCYGAERLTTPTVDGLAAAGMRFDDALAVVPITGPSHASMFTSLYPQVHGAFRNGIALKDSTPTLATILSQSGYATGAAVSGWTMKDTQCGLGRGFDRYDDAGMDERYSVVNLMRRADAVTDSALSWADQLAVTPARKPYFLFVHYFDPHEPYESPLTATPGPNPNDAPGPEVAPFKVNLAAYDREIAFADKELGRLLAGLKSRGLLGNAVIAVTADHGQSFGDNGYGGPEGAHGRRIYQSQIAVPLVISAPGRVPAGQSSKLPVSHLDLMPTLLELAGVPARDWPAQAQGSSLVKIMKDPSAAPPWGRASRVRHALAFRGAVGNKWNIFRWAQNKDVDAARPTHGCIVRDGRKVIVEFDKPSSIEVFDLASDPHEGKPLEGERITQQAGWASDVISWYGATRTELAARAPTKEELEAMKSLGYVE